MKQGGGRPPPEPARRPLPRPPSRGLIEAAAPWRAEGRRGALFPGHRAGASLKRGSEPSTRWSTCRPLPRPPSRGLIEAGRVPTLPSSGPCLFPGHRAGASLKPARAARPGSTTVNLFPGHRAGASLKRSRRPLHRPGAETTLPRPPSRGLIEARRGRSPGSGRGLPLFPGHRAGASLKRVHAHVGRKLGHPLPRPPSRGLIEARSVVAAAPTRSAALPRPPSRGLIEARSSRWWTRLSRDSSPATEPGPH